MSARWLTDDRTRLFDWRTAVADSDLPATTKLVALVLSLHMNRAGESCFPGLPLLQRQTSLSRSALQEHLRALALSNWLERRLRPGRGSTTEYMATFPPALVTEIIEKARSAGLSSAEAPEKCPQKARETPAPAAAPSLEDVRTKGREYIQDFGAAWAIYPKRGGTNSRADAERQYAARRREGVTQQELQEGTARYAAFCEATGKTGTEYVMQAVRFFGRGHHYAEAWDAPATPLRGTRPTARLVGKDYLR